MVSTVEYSSFERFQLKRAHKLIYLLPWSALRTREIRQILKITPLNRNTSCATRISFLLLVSVLSLPELMLLESDYEEMRIRVKSINVTFVLKLLCSFNVPWRRGGLWHGDVVILEQNGKNPLCDWLYVRPLLWRASSHEKKLKCNYYH